ncbi:MAG TPA: hypothetical protein P5550_10710 [Bacteroidales bacterium]|nr:hypothetical protein [Bacteroidales bacterium]HRZ76535.1 hypothetical protein [Bacteroidales bacterium]
MIYKYRMLSEANEDFLREFELKASNSFLEFHELIQQTVKFSTLELASFFICDGGWNRMTEITLLDMQEANPDEEGYEPPLMMKDALLRDYMEEPRQRIVYEYDFLRPKTFYIEMNGIAKAEEGTAYPRCVYSRGEPLEPQVRDEEDDFENIEIADIEDLMLDELDEGIIEEGPSEVE